MSSNKPSPRSCILLAALALVLWSIASAPAQTVGPNINVSRMPADKTEPAIAINPSNPNRIFIAANIQDGNGLFAAYSTDAGATWSYTDPSDGVIADGTDGIPESCCDPSVSAAADLFGNVFLVYLKTAGPSGIIVTISTNGGQSFRHLATLGSQDFVGQPTVVTGCNPGCGSGAIWVSYKDSSLTGSPIVAQGAAITALGAVGAFGPAQTVPDSANGDFGDIAIGPDGQVLVTFQSTGANQGPSSIFVSLDPDGLGQTGFGPSTLVTDTGVGALDTIPAQPDRGIDAEAGLAFDNFPDSPHFGRAYLIYTDEAPNESNDTDIFVRYSDNNGASWSSPARVNNDSSGRSQFFPRIAVDSTSGNVAACWYDCRDDAGDNGPADRTPGPNNDAQFYAGVSRDGGLTWSPNLKISEGTSAQASSENPYDFGEYSALAFCAGSFYPVWSDNSNSTGDNPAGANSMEIYTARVTVGTGRAIIHGAGTEIISEGCQHGNGALDPGELVTVEFALENIGGGSTENLVATLLPSGGVVNPSSPQSYGVLAFGDTPQAHPFTFVANGACGGTVTATLELHDGSASYGTISVNFPLGIITTNTQSISNSAPITIADETNASPYASVINVSNVTSVVTKVTVTLHNLLHTYAADLDVLLVGPGGQAVMLMSDAGGTAGINGTITFDDDAPGLPGTFGISPGTYSPHDYQDLFADFFPPPAPDAPYFTSLSVFNGLNPNGAWQLFVVDDAAGDIGTVAGGWSLQFSSPQFACCTAAPELSITPVGASLRVSWPATFTGYSLEATTALGASSSWSAVTNQVTLSNGMNNVSISATGAARFFRLKK